MMPLAQHVQFIYSETLEAGLYDAQQACTDGILSLGSLETLWARYRDALQEKIL